MALLSTVILLRWKILSDNICSILLSDNIWRMLSDNIWGYYLIFGWLKLAAAAVSAISLCSPTVSY